MYRNVIFEFISANYECFKTGDFNQMTLVLLNKKPNHSALLFDKDDEVIVYHTKNQYTFEKKYTIDNLSGTIIEMVLEYKERLDINYNELSYEIKDPYYLKDLREQQFQKLIVIPILNQENLIGVSLVYFDDTTLDVTISNQKWLTFYQKLIDSLDENISAKINSLILKNEKFYIIAKNNENKKYYLNEAIQEYLKIEKNLIDLNDYEFKKINILLEKMIEVKDKTLTIYYLPKNAFEKKSNHNEIEFYMLDSINNHGYQDAMTLIFSRDLENQLSANDLVIKFIHCFNQMKLDIKYKLYQINNKAIIILINKVFSKKEENDLKFMLKKLYHLVIRMPKELPCGVDLIKVVNYLNDNLPLDFDYHEYKNYQNNQNLEFYECAKNNNVDDKIMIKADTLETIGEFISGPIPNYYHLATYKLFEQETIDTLERALKKSYNNPIFTLLIPSINRRKIYELLKKIIVKYSQAKIVLHLPLIMDMNAQEIFETIFKIKKLGYIIIVDSTIYMNLLYSNSLKIVDAVIVRKNEMAESLSSNNSYNQKLFDYLYDDGKVVIFEEIPQEKDASLVNELTCLMIKR